MEEILPLHGRVRKELNCKKYVHFIFFHQSVNYSLCQQIPYEAGAVNKPVRLANSSFSSILFATIILSMECMEPEHALGVLTTQLNCTHPDLTASLLELWRTGGGGRER